jgi:hypothetical protein
LNKLNLQSERYSPTGNASSEGVRNQLGRPDLDVIEVLIREAVQNSWDARLSDHSTVSFDISGWILSENQQQTLFERILVDCPDNLGLSNFQEDSLLVLAISDRNTSGLMGPTRADLVSDSSVPRDFVDFVRNIGTPRDKHLGGGTYGFGKSSLYLASAVSTICVYTRCDTPNGKESRFMAVSLGPSFSINSGEGKGMYTGRHWWGLRSEDGIVDPVTDQSADELASSLGIPGFEAEQTGTSLLIIMPRVDEYSLEDVHRKFESSLLWSFWPKMLHEYHKPPSMEFTFSWNGDSYHVAMPETIAPFPGFAHAIENLKSYRAGKELPHDGKVFEITKTRPDVLLGHLSLVRFLRSSGSRRIGLVEDANDGSSSTWGPEIKSHHVALMRNVELITRYMEGPQLATELLEYGGVFITSEEVDDAFARSEPPTHDDWKPDILEDKRERTLIRVTLREIKARLREFVSPINSDLPGTEQLSMGLASNFLGELVPTLFADGVLAPKGKPAGTGRARKPSARQHKLGVEVLGAGELVKVEDKICARFTIRANRDENIQRVVINAHPKVVVNNGRSIEKEAPQGDDIAEVLYWANSKNGKQLTNQALSLESGDPDEWSVIVSIPNDAMVNVDFTISQWEVG